jgi:hypothetical protein
MVSLFVSHWSEDRALAAALKRLLEACLPGHVEVKASSASPGEGGIPSGSDWFDWIRMQVSGSEFTAVLLTPGSLGKPWLMWEAGAVAGVAMAREKRLAIVPVVYRVSAEQIPSPLRTLQGVLGEDRASLLGMLESVRSETKMPSSAMEALADHAVSVYLDEVKKAMAEIPPPLTESRVQDWLDRIAYFEPPTDGRRSAKCIAHWSTSSRGATTPSIRH